MREIISQPLSGTDEVGTVAWILASLLSAVAVVAACAVCAGSKTDSTEADAGVKGTEIPPVANASQSPVLVRCMMFFGMPTTAQSLCCLLRHGLLLCPSKTREHVLQPGLEKPGSYVSIDGSILPECTATPPAASSLLASSMHLHRQAVQDARVTCVNGFLCVCWICHEIVRHVLRNEHTQVCQCHPGHVCISTCRPQICHPHLSEPLFMITNLYEGG